MNISNIAKGILHKQEVRAKFPYLVHFEYRNGQGEIEDYYYCNSDGSIEYNGNTYHPAVFEVTPPEITSTSVGNATITISAVDQVWIEKIRNTQERVKIEFTGVMMYDKEGELQVEPVFANKFVLTNASWNDISITWTMVFDDKWDIQFPCMTCNEITVPALV